MQIRLITLDLDNTLWPVEPVIRGAEQAMRRWLGEQVPGFNERYPFEALAPFREAVVQAQPALAHDLSQLRLRVMEQALLAFGCRAAQARTLATQAFEIFIAHRHRVQYYPGVEALLSRLARRYPLAALSNGNADVMRLSVAPSFHFSCSAADIGASKPSPDMFLAALARAGVPPEQAVHVGDNLVDDIQGARSVGMNTIWLDWHDRHPPTEATQQPTARIRDIAELELGIEALEARLGSASAP